MYYFNKRCNFKTFQNFTSENSNSLLNKYKLHLNFNDSNCKEIEFTEIKIYTLQIYLIFCSYELVYIYCERRYCSNTNLFLSSETLWLFVFGALWVLCSPLWLSIPFGGHHFVNKIHVPLTYSSYSNTTHCKTWAWNTCLLLLLTTLYPNNKDSMTGLQSGNIIREDPLRTNINTEVNIRYSGIGITFFSMCQMAPSILFQWDISNFNGPFDNLNAPKGRKWVMA